MQEQQNGTEQTRASESGKKSVRDARGRFVVGVSGNPRGLAPRTPEMLAVRELAAVERTANIARLVEIRDNAADVWARIEAVKLLLQYSDGKPVTAHVGAPLVAMQFNGVAPQSGGQALTAADAYRAMNERIIEADPRHPAFVAEKSEDAA